MMVEMRSQPQIYSEIEADNIRLREALRQIAQHPEEHRGTERSYAVGWAFWNVQRIARRALETARAGIPVREVGGGDVA